MGRFSRRDFLRASSSAALLGASFGCSGSISVNSPFVPTPETPLTPTENFYVTSCCGQPDPVGAEAFRLELGGLVDEPRNIGFEELITRFESVTRELTLECIGNSPGGRLISSAAFTGVRLSDVLDFVRLSDRARGLFLEGRDGYLSFVPRSAGTDGEALLVYEINGARLDETHGAPVRVLFPGRYGMKSVKWVHQIIATRSYHEAGAFRGVDTYFDGVNPLRSKVFALPELRAGTPSTLTGLALTPGLGVAKVEVDTGEGWRPAEITFNQLEDEHSPYLWTLWKFEITPTESGLLTVRVRAYDRLGNTQSETPHFPYDNSAIHTVRSRVL